MTMRKTVDRRKAIEGMSGWSPGIKLIHEISASCIRLVEISADWIRRGLPEIVEFSRGFAEPTVFVLGTGPSIQKVTSRQWERLEKAFTIGVNMVAYELEKFNVQSIPKVGFVVDEIGEEHMKVAFLEPMLRMGTRIIVSEAVLSMPSHYVAPCPCWYPDWGLDAAIAIPLTMILGKQKYNLSILGAAYLGAALKANVVLLGVDHKDYQEDAVGENMVADLHFAKLREFLEAHDRTIVNAGEETLLESIPRVSLEEVLDDNGL